MPPRNRLCNAETKVETFKATHNVGHKRVGFNLSPSTIAQDVARIFTTHWPSKQGSRNRALKIIPASWCKVPRALDKWGMLLLLLLLLLLSRCCCCCCYFLCGCQANKNK